VKFEEKALKGNNRRLLIECIKKREKGSKGWIGKERIFTDKMDLIWRELKILERERKKCKGHN